MSRRNASAEGTDLRHHKAKSCHDVNKCVSTEEDWISMFLFIWMYNDHHGLKYCNNTGCCREVFSRFCLFCTILYRKRHMLTFVHSLWLHDLLSTVKHMAQDVYRAQDLGYTHCTKVWSNPSRLIWVRENMWREFNIMRDFYSFKR